MEPGPSRIYGDASVSYTRNTAASPALAQSAPQNGATEVARLAEAVCARTERLASELEQRLSRLMMPPGPECPDKPAMLSTVAPLFSDVRSSLRATMASLDAIGAILTRLDID